jgi:hypothetical protein
MIAMDLIRCPHCDAVFPDSMTRCPRCRRDPNPRPVWATALWIVGIIAAVLAVLMLVFGR